MHTDALVLRVASHREHDRLVTLFTRQQGRVSAVARGSQRSSSRQAPALDTGNILTCELVAGRATPIITGACARRCHAAMKSSVLRSAAAHCLLQSVDAVLFDGQQDERLWHALVGALDAFDRTSDHDAVTVLRTWQAHLLDVLGYGVVPVPTDHQGARTALDERFEQIAGRRLPAQDLLYRLVEGRF